MKMPISVLFSLLLNGKSRNELTAKADEQAIEVFGENLRNLLLQSPLKGKVVMGFDPAYQNRL